MELGLQRYQTTQYAKINNTSYRVNESAIYSIENVKMTLLSISDNQTAAFGQNQIITFEGGKIEATINFQWFAGYNNTGQFILHGGQATAKAISKELPWAITVMEVDRYYKRIGLGVFDIGKIVFNEFNITDIDCDFYKPECEVTA